MRNRILMTVLLQGQPKSQKFKNKKDKCIRDCNNTYPSCDEAIAFLEQPDCTIKDSSLLDLLKDCSSICQLTAQSLGGSSPFAKAICELCAQITDRSAQNCDAYPNEKKLKICAENCRTCAASCRDLLTVWD